MDYRYFNTSDPCLLHRRLQTIYAAAAARFYKRYDEFPQQFRKHVTNGERARVGLRGLNG